MTSSKPTLGGGDGVAHLGELVGVLDEAQLAEVAQQAGVEVGDVGVERPVLASARARGVEAGRDARVGVAQHDGGEGRRSAARR